MTGTTIDLLYVAAGIGLVPALIGAVAGVLAWRRAGGSTPQARESERSRSRAAAPGLPARDALHGTAA
jgi:hypothetical protein